VTTAELLLPQPVNGIAIAMTSVTASIAANFFIVFSLSL
jgi:hypothetical protein